MCFLSSHEKAKPIILLALPTFDDGNPTGVSIWATLVLRRRFFCIAALGKSLSDSNFRKLARFYVISSIPANNQGPLP